MAIKGVIDRCIVLLVALAFISCGQSPGSGAGAKAVTLKDLDKQTLMTMIERLHQSLDVKDYSVDKGMSA